MRKPRDFDTELAALTAKARALRTRKIVQLGEMVVASGAERLPIDVLAGAMVAAAATKETATLEVWRQSGVAFFRSASRSAARRNRGDARGAPAGDGGTESSAGQTGAQ